MAHTTKQIPTSRDFFVTIYKLNIMLYLLEWESTMAEQNLTEEKLREYLKLKASRFYGMVIYRDPPTPRVLLVREIQGMIEVLKQIHGEDLVNNDIVEFQAEQALKRAGTCLRCQKVPSSPGHDNCESCIKEEG